MRVIASLQSDLDAKMVAKRRILEIKDKDKVRRII
jgi:hypothetical protein